MAPKIHPTPLSGGDRKAVNKELGKARAMTNILAAQSVEMRTKAETMLQQADKLLCESWNERMWADGEPIDPFADHRSGRQRRLPLVGDPVFALQDAERRGLGCMRHPPTTFVHDLASRLRCRKCAKAGRRPAATLLKLAWQPRHPLRTSEHVQSLFDHHQSGGHQRAVPDRQSVRRQPRADARRLPGLRGADRARRHRRPRARHRAVGYAIVVKGPDGCRQEASRKAAGQGQDRRFQGIAPDGAGRGTTTFATCRASTGRGGWDRSTAVWCRSTRSASSTN